MENKNTLNQAMEKIAEYREKYPHAVREVSTLWATTLSGTSLISKGQNKNVVADKKTKECFLGNAYFLLAHADQVFADSRMFFAPVQEEWNILGAIKNPTLGMMLEWWIYGIEDAREDTAGRPALLYHFGGLLSGTSTRSYIYPDGTTRSEVGDNFAILRNSLWNIYRRYKHMADCESYPLEEVVERLKKMDDEKK